ncbi:MAG: hypothetical protein U0800_23335 [Isosphaeraceae bacterium]
MSLWALTGSQWLTVAWSIISLVLLEILLSADNALVLAMMVRHLPRDLQKKALLVGIWGAFVFRLLAVVFASMLLDFWIFQVVGGAYLLFLAIKHFLLDSEEGDPARPRKQARGFWSTVVALNLADSAFSIDSILAAVGLANKLDPEIRDSHVLYVSTKLWIIYVGGILGILAMRFVAGVFLRVLERFPALADGAYLLVAWIGLNLVGEGLHKALNPHGGEPPAWLESVPDWVHSIPLQVPRVVFWAGMVLIPLASILFFKPRGQASKPAEPAKAPAEMAGSTD